MTVTAETPEIIKLVYRQEKTDADYGSCLFARFYFDTKSYTLLIESDCGIFGYKWFCTPGTESFVHLMCRCSPGYILDKISRPSVVDTEATVSAIKQCIHDYEFIPGDISDDELTEACSYETNVEVHQALQELDWSEYGDYELWQCIELTHPAGAKRIVQVFENYIKPELRKMMEETE